MGESIYTLRGSYLVLGPHFCPFSASISKIFILGKPASALLQMSILYKFLSPFRSLFLPFFFFSFLSPFPTPFCPAVSTIYGCNSAHKAWDGGMGPLFSIHTSTLHIVWGWMRIYATLNM